MQVTAVFQVDTFTREPFHGNPAAVCLNQRMPDAAWMQAVATGLRMPATAFVAGDGPHRQLRWFTPTAELEICGHGTLAAAHILWEIEKHESLEFATPAGAIAAHREGDSSFITLETGEVTEAEPPTDLIAALNTTPAAVWRTPLDFLVELESPQMVVAFTPDFEILERVDTRGVIVTAPGGTGAVDFTSRFFAPRLGLLEDSVTGSAHASLAPFWGKRLGKTSLRARQASRRGGLLDLRLHDELVDIGGPAVTVAHGKLRVEAT